MPRYQMTPTTLDDVEWWVTQALNFADGVEFAGPNFFRPFHFGVLAHQLIARRAIGVKVGGPVAGYAARMQLWQAVELQPPADVQERNPGGKFHPLTAIRSEEDAEQAALDIREIFKACGTSDEGTLNAIFTMLVEIIGNCFFHSETTSQIRGLVCAQSWPASAMAQVAVVDNGIGIRRSLQRNPAYTARLAVENANELATGVGVTGKPGANHAGYGLALARQLLEQQGGNFILLSGQEVFTAARGKAMAKNLTRPWDGTIVIMEWNTDHPFDAAAVYSSWPAPEEDFL